MEVFFFQSISFAKFRYLRPSNGASADIAAGHFSYKPVHKTAENPLHRISSSKQITNHLYIYLLYIFIYIMYYTYLSLLLLSYCCK